MDGIVGAVPVVPKERPVPQQRLDRQPKRRPWGFGHHQDPRRIGPARNIETAQLANGPCHGCSDVCREKQPARAGEGRLGQVRQGQLGVSGLHILDGVDGVDEAGDEEEDADRCPAADAEPDDGELEEQGRAFLGGGGGVEIWGECGQDVAGYDDEGGDSAQALGNVNLGTGGAWGCIEI